MRPVFTAQRRADEFEALVEGSEPLSPRDQQRYADLLALVGTLRTAPQPSPRPDFVADLRERLMAEADTVLLPLDADTQARLRLTSLDRDPRRVRRDRRVASLLGGAAIIGATTSVAVAAQTALPGDTLYPVKRALENAEAGVAIGDDDKGAVILANARLRLEEIGELVERDSPEGRAAMPDTITSFGEQAEEASTLLLEDFRATGREGSVTELRAFTRTSMERLAELADTLPPEAHDELVAAVDRLLEIDDAARRACPTCAGQGITEMPAILGSGGILSGTTLPADWPTLPALPELGGATDLNNRTGSGGDRTTGGAGGGQGSLPAPTPTAGLPVPVPVPGGGGGTSPTNPIDGLEDTLLGGVGTAAPSLPAGTGGVLGDTGDLLGGTVEGLLGDDAGDAVTDTTDGLGGAVGGLLD